jgi:hypothetical protein
MAGSDIDPLAASTALGMQTAGTQRMTPQSAAVIFPFISQMRAAVSVGVLFIFQLPAITVCLFDLSILYFLFSCLFLFVQ